MEFDLIRVRDEGRPIPRYQLAFKRAVRGELAVSDQADPELGRSTRVARFLEPGTGREIAEVPPLFDASLVGARKGFLAVAGFERVPDPLGRPSREVAQTWILRAPDGE